MSSTSASIYLVKMAANKALHLTAYSVGSAPTSGDR